MQFKEFARKLSSVISAGGSTDKFTKTLFSSILIDEGLDILDEYKPSSYKGFFNGNTSIKRIANKINAYIEPMEFSSYIHSFSDAAVENLCTVFIENIPDINPSNAGDKLAELFVSIITEAAGAKKRSTLNGASEPKHIPPIIIDPNGKAPDLGFYQDGVLYFEKIRGVDEYEVNPFTKYLDVAVTYYSTKKTLLYAEKPHPFYDLYVCNDVRYKKFRVTGVRDLKTEKIISNATVAKLEAESKYVIIEGIGGIGKSMLLTHLFLSSAKETYSTGITPLLLSLKSIRI